MPLDDSNARSLPRTGLCRTISGRRGWLLQVRSAKQRRSRFRQRLLPERIAINTVIQGSAADLIKQQAMIHVYCCLRIVAGEKAVADSR